MQETAWGETGNNLALPELSLNSSGYPHSLDPLPLSHYLPRLHPILTTYILHRPKH